MKNRLLLGRIAGLCIRSVLLASLVATALFYTIGFLALLFDLTTMVFISGSMAPAIKNGDGVLVKRLSLDSIRAGDVISFRNSNNKVPITHRVIAITEVNERLFFRTKGDANSASDPDLVPVSGVYGKVVFTVPKVGQFLRIANNPLWKLALVSPFLLLVTIKLWELSTNSNDYSKTADRRILF